MMKCLLALVLSAVPLAVAGAAEEITIERLFGPEIPGKYKHPASITELDNGDLYVVYYGGEGEYEGDTAVYGSRLAKGSDRVDAAQDHCRHARPLRGQRRHLASARRPGVAVLHHQLRPHLVHVADQVQALQGPGPDVDRFRHAGLRAGFDGSRPADRAQ